MQTFCTVLHDPRAEAILAPYADVMGRAMRWQFRRIYHWQQPELAVRKQAQSVFGLTKRQALANEFDLKQVVEAWRGTLDYRLSQMMDRREAWVTQQQGWTKKLQGLCGKVMAHRKPLSKAKSTPVAAKGKSCKKPALTSHQAQLERGRLRQKIFQKNQDILRLDHQMVALKVERAGKPTPCFGGRTLLRQHQRFLNQVREAKANTECLESATEGPGADQGKESIRAMEREADHALAQWQAKRRSRFLLVGSKGETAGNQSAQYDPQHQTLTLRLPEAQVEQARLNHGEAIDRHGRITLTGVQFGYGHRAIEKAMVANQALTWLFFGDDRGRWHVHVTLEPEVVPVVMGNPDQAGFDATGRRPGRIGVDLNVDHVAITVIDGHGNPIGRHTVPFPVQGTPSGLAQAMVADGVKALTDLAQQHQIGLAVEDLDFTKKKAALKVYGKAHARRLFAWGYAKFRDCLKARTARLGIHVAWVNPAYTSVIGEIKYARGYAMSRHHAAALVIARRAQQRSERFVCMAHASQLRPETASCFQKAKGGNGARHRWIRWRNASVLAVPTPSVRSGGRTPGSRQPLRLGLPPPSGGGAEHSIQLSSSPGAVGGATGRAVTADT